MNDEPSHESSPSPSPSLSSLLMAEKSLLETAINMEEIELHTGGGGGGRGGAAAAAAPAMNRLTAREMESLRAISDTFLPSINTNTTTTTSSSSASTSTNTSNTSSTSTSTDDDDHHHHHPSSSSLQLQLKGFYFTSATMLSTPETVGRYMSGRLRHPMLWLLRLTLWLLSTWYGTLMVCGPTTISSRFPYFQPFSRLDHRRREEIIRGWSSSKLRIYRQLFRALKFLILLFYFTQVNEKNENPTWQAMGYCGPDPRQVKLQQRVKKSSELDDPDDDERERERLGPLHRSMVYMENSSRAALSSALSRAGISLTTRRHPHRPKPILNICCDVVVVGSGSGGGVVAGVLASAGYKVVVLEKGGYHARTGLTLLEGPTMDQMYEGGGLLATDDTGVIILSGSAVGGGSAINWAASLRTPDHVMREWREEHGLELFGSDAYEEALHAVCGRMGVQAEEAGGENLSNAALRRGCTELGYPVRNIPRNSPPDHDCGWCCFGCLDGRKKGTGETWLVDMAESGNGVVLPGCTAVRVLSREQGKGRRRVASGVEFEFINNDGWSGPGEKEMCMVESKVTVVACGALGTPMLLKRSGLRNHNIGRNLHLHPVVMVWGHFPDDDHHDQGGDHADCYKGKTSYEGGIMTAMSTVVVRSRSRSKRKTATTTTGTNGYGAVIQTPSLHPGMFSVVTPWTSGEEFKRRMSRFSRTAHVFALARDRGTGTVGEEAGSIGYRMAASDEEVLKRGVEQMLRIMAAAGAAEVGTQHGRGKSVDVRRASSHEFERFVRAESGRGLRDLSTPVCSAHQMGSCRMGTSAGTSAVDPRGETWEVEGLFVADSSVFPTALGVNPMVTVQAIAYCTANSIVDILKRKMKTKKKKMNNNNNK